MFQIIPTNLRKNALQEEKKSQRQTLSQCYLTTVIYFLNLLAILFPRKAKHFVIFALILHNTSLQYMNHSLASSWRFILVQTTQTFRTVKPWHPLGDHPFSTYTKFSKKLTFLTP